MDLNEKQCLLSQSVRPRYLEPTPAREMTVKYCSQEELTFMPPGSSQHGVSYVPAYEGPMKINADRQLYEYLYPVHRRGERYYISRRFVPRKLQSLLRPAVELKVAPMAEFRISLPTGHIPCSEQRHGLRCRWRHHAAFPRHYEALSVMQRIDMLDDPNQANSPVESPSIRHGTIPEVMFQKLVCRYKKFIQHQMSCVMLSTGESSVFPPVVRKAEFHRLALTAFGEIGAGVERDFYDFFLNFGGEEMAERFMKSHGSSWLYYTHRQVNCFHPFEVQEKEYVNQGIKQAWASRKHYSLPRYWLASLVDLPHPNTFCNCPGGCPGHPKPHAEAWPPENIHEIVEEMRAARKINKEAIDAKGTKELDVQKAEPYLCATYSAETACLLGYGRRYEADLETRRWASRGPYHNKKIVKEYKAFFGHDDVELGLREKLQYSDRA